MGRLAYQNSYWEPGLFIGNNLVQGETVLTCYLSWKRLPSSGALWDSRKSLHCGPRGVDPILAILPLAEYSWTSQQKASIFSSVKCGLIKLYLDCALQLEDDVDTISWVTW